ncbi:MAG: PLP-dependent transferase [Flavobacteriales bacterium]|nr:PLP-dependent transferase [Flavobacteriales bacterium]
MKFGTKAIHAGVEPDPTTGAIMTPIYQTSTYDAEAPSDRRAASAAARHNPLAQPLCENALAALENGTHGLLQQWHSQHRCHHQTTEARR